MSVVNVTLPIINSPFFNTTGANAGLYTIGTQAIERAESMDECCLKLTLPCTWKPQFNNYCINVEGDKCAFNMCMINSVLATVASTLTLQTDKLGALPTPLTAKEKACLASKIDAVCEKGCACGGGTTQLK